MWQILLLCSLAGDPASWWKTYGDPVLDDLIQRAGKQNHSLRLAAARVAEARALSGEARSALAPGLNFNTSAQQLRGGFQQGIIRVPEPGVSGAGASFVAPFETGLLSSGLDTRWEVSFWGPNPKRLSAARADLLAQQESEGDVRVIVTAEVARTYFELRGLERQIGVARRNRDLEAGLLELTRQRAQAGLSPELDVERQAAALASLEAAIPPLEAQRILRLNRLGVLLADRDLAARTLPPAPPNPALPRVNQGVDSELLLRRPDLRAAQARILAATARLKAARSEMYPRLLLTGLMGRQATNVSGFSLGGGNFFGAGPQLVLPVFTGGRIRANIAASDARLEQARLAYEQELSAAFQEAEDALAGYRLEQDRLSKLREAHSRAATALRLSRDLYQAGLGDFLGVLEAEKSVLELDLAIAQAETSTAVQSVLLFKALAGGWPQ